jgi:hypothetical protein
MYTRVLGTRIGNAAATGGLGTLAATGAAVHQMVGLAIALFILGGILLTVAHLGPRFAIEPVQGPDGSYRMRLTRNGTPIRRSA